MVLWSAYCMEGTFFKWQKSFWPAVRLCKANLALKDLARQKRMKMWLKRMLSWCLIDISQSKWSVVCSIWITKPSTAFWSRNWHADSLILRHDYVPCHIALYVKEVVNKNCFALVPMPPYSLDLSSCDFVLFLKLKFHLKVCHLVTTDSIQYVVTHHLRARPHEDFQHCYRVWDQLLPLCVASQWNYFEGDVVNI
jgi:hypothetical protein